MSTFENAHQYRDPIGGTDSTVGGQIRVDYYYRMALVEAAKESYFGQMASVKNMPKNMGKTLKMFHYLPILDDRNINDQGIDAAGVSTAAGFVANETLVKATIRLDASPAAGGDDYYVEGLATGVDFATAKAAALADAQANAWAWLIQEEWVAASTLNYTAAKAAVEADGWTVTELPATDDEYVNYGNLYGSSKDVGTVASKLPALSENGGRVNRVGMKRTQIEGSINKFGFFDEYTQESLDFDTDAALLEHITKESVKAANQITEDQLQIDLLNGAGVVRFAGLATAEDELSGSTAAGGTADTVTYDDFVQLDIELDNNRTPKNTTVIAGSRMFDTRVVNAARYAYIGSELLPTLMRLKDYHDEKAWIPVAHYAQAGNVARGEEGAIHSFRFIVVPEMMHWKAAGAVVSDTADEICNWGVNSAGENRINVYPILVVGDESFATIGFQTDGKTVKFKITHKKPGVETADRHDPYGEVGFYSIKWYYGFMVLRPERLAVIKTVATL
jgi:N4-gp56 family major capsid protein